MKIALRVDASHTIGSGHVMRCLTLAEALREKGAQVHFLCRTHKHHLIDLIRRRGYSCSALQQPLSLPGGRQSKQEIHEEMFHNMPDSTQPLPEHAAWLGADWRRDAEESAAVLQQQPYDWLIVDHYAIDWRWESVLRPLVGKIMVIDELADRKHHCDVLLDASCHREASSYRGLLPTAGKLLLGSKFALLRPEFAAWRETALQRHEKSNILHRFLVTLGGMDAGNLSGMVLTQLATAGLPDDTQIDVVLGAGFPCVEQLQDQAEKMPVKTVVSVAVDNMAERMANADFAIAAGGVSVLECCCMGLPALILIAAKNQRHGAQQLEKAMAVRTLPVESLATDFQPHLASILQDRAWYRRAVLHGSQLVDGRGVERIVRLFFPAGELRPVVDADLQDLLRWRNHPKVRRAMTSQHEISPQEHARWWRKTRADSSKRWYIYMEENRPVAVVDYFRIDWRKKVGWWGFYLCNYSSQKPSGHGVIAQRVIAEMIRHAFGGMELHLLLCEVRRSNSAVIRLYEQAGFVEVAAPGTKDADLMVMQLQKQED